MPCCVEIEAGMESFKSAPTKFRLLTRERYPLKLLISTARINRASVIGLHSHSALSCLGDFIERILQPTPSLLNRRRISQGRASARLAERNSDVTEWQRSSHAIPFVSLVDRRARSAGVCRSPPPPRQSRRCI